MSKTKADKAKRAAKAKAKAKADKAKEANANKATTTAKATTHSSEARVAPTAAALLSFHAGGAPRIIPVGAECSGMELVAMALRNLGVLDQRSLEFCCEIN